MNEFVLVEGPGDEDFIEGFFTKIGKLTVKPYPPKPLGGPSNGIDNVMKMIPVMVNLIRAGQTTKAAIVVDADFTGINGGFADRRKKITDRLAAEGYQIPAGVPAGAPPGELFIHPDGHAPIGLFIMPNHKDDGMLEDLLKQMVMTTPYNAVLQHAGNVVGTLPTKLFNTALHTSKAEIGTFLAWQKRPPSYTGICLRDGIFDVSAPGAKDFVQWANRVF